MFVGRNRPSFVDSLQGLIREFDSSGVCGWIVDLRKNHGGNMWPMLAGLGPLLGDSIVGSFGPASDGALWRYRDGQAWSGSNERPSWGGLGTSPPHRLRHPDAPVALLIGRATASSGEATLMAFLGRPHTRSFGDSTAGFNSVNNSYQLPDGATMLITVGYSRDRLGRSYPLRIAPDEVVNSPPGSSPDSALERATGWLNQHPACVGS
jgi:C-terminal processing protease CtpA/Prc